MTLIAIYTIWLREVKLYFRARSRLAASLAGPFFWLAFAGIGLRSSFAIADLKVNYLEFMAPGIMGMSVLFTSLFSGVSVLWEKQFGFLKEILIAPVSRSAIVAGKILGGATIALFQGVLMLLLIWAVGVKISSTAGALLALLFVILISSSFVALGLSFASRLEDPHGFTNVMGFIAMPIFFLSGALFPLDRLPEWLKILTYLDPLTYGVDALRYSLIGMAHFPLWLDFSVLAGFLLAMTALGSHLFKKAA